MTVSIIAPKRTNEYKALVEVLGEALAVETWNTQHPDCLIPTAAPAVDPAVAKLVAVGYSEADATALIAKGRAAVAANAATEPAKAEVEVPLTSKDLSDVEVAKAGLVHVRGRIYSTPALVEAQVRVFTTGTPEIIRVEGGHRTAAIALYRMDDGLSVAVQNLGVPR